MVSQTQLDEFHRALAIFDPSESFETPGNWISSNASQVIRNIQAFAGLDGYNLLLCESLIHSVPVYQRLIAYVFVHISTCSQYPWVQDDFIKALQTWNTWKPVTWISQYRVIGEQILEYLPQVQNGSAHSGLCSSRSEIRSIIDLDLTAICAQLACILIDPSQYRELVSSPADDAKPLVNLLQTLLDFPGIDPPTQRLFGSSLLALSRRSGIAPEFPIIQTAHLSRDVPVHVSTGPFGGVWKSCIRGHPISMKTIILTKERHLKKLPWDAVRWRQISHPNVLPLYSIYDMDNRQGLLGLVLISPWMADGNVMQFLHANPDTERLDLVRDVARGLQYLHSNDIVHGNLKGSNILITPSHTACIVDFGYSGYLKSQESTVLSSPSSMSIKSTRWEAPELLDGGRRASFAADIYALACVAYEIFSGRVPFHECSDNMLDFNIKQGVKPSRPSPHECSRYGLTDGVWDLMMECWQTDPATRPNATTVVSRLDSFSMPNRDKNRGRGRERSLHEWDLSFISRVRSLLAANPFPLPAVDDLRNGPTAVQLPSFTRFTIPDMTEDGTIDDARKPGRPDAGRLSLKQRESSTPRKNATRSLRSRIPYDDITRRRRSNKGGRRMSLILNSESQTTSNPEGTSGQQGDTVRSVYQDPSGPHPLPIVSVPVPVPPGTDHETELDMEDLNFQRLTGDKTDIDVCIHVRSNGIRHDKYIVDSSFFPARYITPK